MAIKLKLEGFDDLLKKIEKANGNVESATKTCVNEGAKILQHQLVDEMNKSNVDSGLISRMPNYEIENNFGLITARVGYKKGDYNPTNISDGYKVVFLNYGTPRRSKHGKIKDVSAGGTIKLGFIQRAKKNSKSKIYTVQKKTLDDILKGLEK